MDVVPPPGGDPFFGEMPTVLSEPARTLSTKLKSKEYVYVIRPLSAHKEVMNYYRELRQLQTQTTTQLFQNTLNDFLQGGGGEVPTVAATTRTDVLLQAIDATPLYSRIPYLYVDHVNSTALTQSQADDDMHAIWKPRCFIDVATRVLLIDCRGIIVPAYDPRIDTPLAFQRILELCHAACRHFRAISIMDLDPVAVSGSWHPRHVAGNRDDYVDRASVIEILNRCAIEQQQHMSVWSMFSEQDLINDMVWDDVSKKFKLQPNVGDMRVRLPLTSVRWVSERCTGDPSDQFFSVVTGYGGLWSVKYPEKGPLIGSLLPAYYDLAQTDPNIKIAEAALPQRGPVTEASRSKQSPEIGWDTILKDPESKQGFRELCTTRFVLLFRNEFVPRQLEFSVLPFSAMEPIKTASPENVGAPALLLLNGEVVPRIIAQNSRLLLAPGMTLSVGFPLSCAALAWDVSIGCMSLDPTRTESGARIPADEQRAAVKRLFANSVGTRSK